MFHFIFLKFQDNNSYIACMNNNQKDWEKWDAQPLPNLEIFSHTFDLTYK